MIASYYVTCAPGRPRSDEVDGVPEDIDDSTGSEQNGSLIDVDLDLDDDGDSGPDGYADDGEE